MAGVITGLLLCACSAGHPRSAPPGVHPSSAATSTPTETGVPPTEAPSTLPATTAAPTTVPPPTTSPTPSAALPSGRPLAGRTVGVDPGHNGLNYTDPTFINQQVFNGREDENCNTTGTQTDAGYTEAQFNWNVASYLSADLRQEGAAVVLTRPNNDGVGPCVTTRAHIIDQSGAAVAIDIHADGGPPDGRGFAILEPVADGPNDSIVSPSDQFGLILRQYFEQVTGMPTSTYDGVDGFQPRDNLAGLNLTTVPEVLIECGNMRNATDATLLTSSAFQQKAALAIALAITRFLV